MAKSWSSDGVNVDDVGSGDGKREVDCVGEADDDDDGVIMMQMVVLVIARMMRMKMVFMRIGVLMGKVMIRLRMSKLRVLQVALQNVVEVLKRKWQWEKYDEEFWRKHNGKWTKG